MADEVLIETTSSQIVEVAVPGPQGPTGATGATGPQGPTIATENAPATNNILWEARTGAFTAVSGGRYVASGTFAVTNPSGGTDGELYQVVVSSGTVTINGVAYAASRWPVTVARVSGAWTTLANSLTENLTLNGTNSTAPNQTAASGSSIMTRDLVDAEYILSPNIIQLNSMTGAAAGTNGTILTNFHLHGDARLRPGNSNGGYSSCWFAKNFTGQSSSRIDFSRRIEVAGQIQILTADNVDGVVRLLVGASYSSAVPPLADVNAFTGAGMGFEVDSNSGSSAKRVRLIYHDGTAYKQSAWHTFANSASLQNLAITYAILSSGTGNITLRWAIAGLNHLGALSLTGTSPVLTVTDGPTGTSGIDQTAILAANAQQTSAYVNYATAIFSPMKFRIN